MAVFYDTFIQGSISVLRMNSVLKNPSTTQTRESLSLQTPTDSKSEP